MTALSDEQYEYMLREKILKVEVEIALIDDRIGALRQQSRDLEAQKKREAKQSKEST